MLKADRVTKKFGRFEAVAEASILLNQGSIYGLLGSNGAGKTTFLKMLAGIIEANSGTIELRGENVFEQPKQKQQILFVPDQPAFFHQSTLKQMGFFYQTVYTQWNEKRFWELQKHFAFDSNQKLSRMSKGMQRQAAFILAISAMPDVMILDEPFDGLDPIVRQQVKNLLIQEVSNRSMSILVSSHNLREMEDFCDAVAIMHQGRILYERELEELKSGISKVQVAFRKLPDETFFKGMDLVHYEKRGRVLTCIVRGAEEEIDQYVRSFDPAIYDVLPLTLEEIFTYEMGNAGYEIQNLIV